MNPGLVVKLRPSGPWRIGPDSGARNRVDVIYHSDSLYSAITAAMVRLGWLSEWLDATARTGSPAVSFSSCFPYVDDLVFVVPPRTVWPPPSPSAQAARIRWKSARFVPLTVVQSILAGKRLDDSQWSVDGSSDCLVPTGKPGPFRTAVRSNAGVDRLTGAAERHSTACIEFRPGSGLWTVVSFADQAAHEAWSSKVKAAFRLLADSGFGGERSRGWGRSEAPEFIEGMLPDLILPAAPEVAEAAVIAPTQVAAMVAEAAPVVEPEPAAETAELVLGGDPERAKPEPEMAVAEPEPPAPTPEVAAVEPEPAPAEAQSPVEPAAPPAAPEVAVAEPEPAPVEAQPPVEPEVPPATPEVAVAEPAPAPVETHPAAPPPVHAGSPTHPHWLLSLFTPAPADTVDWRRGNYTTLARGGRVDSPAGAGELKKQIQMVSEGSVLYAESAPRGSAADVAPDGFAHPVFRAGFAVAIPLPEVR